MPFPTTSTLDLPTVRSITTCPPSPLTSQWLYRDAFRRVLHFNQDTAVSSPHPVQGFLNFVFSSKGSLFHSRGNIFMFGSTTIIFVLATVVIIVGPGLTLQAIPGFITFIEPSINIGWSLHKIDIMTGIVASITRINVGSRFPSFGFLLRYNKWPLLPACDQRHGLRMASCRFVEV